MKEIRVAAAVIMEDGKIFAAQRGYGEFEGKWEFPGGKLESGESPEEALVREIREELGADIEVGKHLGTVEYDYPKFHLSMDCYLCRMPEGGLTLLEHKAARWLAVEQLDEVDWLPASVLVFERLRKELTTESHR